MSMSPNQWRNRAEEHRIRARLEIDPLVTGSLMAMARSCENIAQSMEQKDVERYTMTTKGGQNQNA